jgi:acyl-CoA thioesterase II
MGDLGKDTAVLGGDGHYTSLLSRDWEIWGPMGGYVAAVALRAAGAHSRFDRPASLVGHFLGVAGFDDEVHLTTTTRRAASRAESIAVSITQEGKPIFDALVWSVAEGVAGLEHDCSRLGDIGPPEQYPTVLEHLARMGEEANPPYEFWNNFEQRPLEWLDNWEEREPTEPVWETWLRYLVEPDPSDLYLCAARLLVLVDVGSWPAVTRLHVDTKGLYAPSLDLACQFHRIAPGASPLFVRGESPSGTDGLLATHQQVWSRDRELLASGVSQLLCRPGAR